MPTEIYKSCTVQTMGGELLYITPLKIKYMKQFMEAFKEISKSSSDIHSIEVLSKCCLIAMQQYCPSIKTIDHLEDSFDMNTLYQIIDVGAGITLNKPSDNPEEEAPKPQKKNDSSWDSLDLAALESEAFLLGIWKDYEDLETSLSMVELSSVLEAKREAEYQDKKFSAALQGVNLDEQNGKQEENPWEAMKARVAAKLSGVSNNGAGDIASFVGQRAKKAGFGIGMGLEYEKQ